MWQLVLLLLLCFFSKLSKIFVFNNNISAQFTSHKKHIPTAHCNACLRLTTRNPFTKAIARKLSHKKAFQIKIMHVHDTVDCVSGKSLADVHLRFVD